ncbi:MAG: hypothetical protein QHH75_09410 [Bacillota bacterium]|jgi:hypothetical protein|nr:hypothetical protein [Bacillota bacterium]
MINRIAHPETSPPEIPQPETAPVHPGSDRPEISPPLSPPEEEPVITGSVCSFWLDRQENSHYIEEKY